MIDAVFIPGEAVRQSVPDDDPVRQGAVVFGPAVSVRPARDRDEEEQKEQNGDRDHDDCLFHAIAKLPAL